MNTVKRFQVADYISKTGETQEYALCGLGFNTLDETFGAQSDTKIYINQKSSASQVKSYQSVFPYNCDLMEDQTAVEMLYDIGRNHKTGEDAQLYYVRVELWRPIAEKENTFSARRFLVSVEAADATGAGGETIVSSGNLNAVGDPVDGEFNTQTLTFTPATDAA